MDEPIRNTYRVMSGARRLLRTGLASTALLLLGSFVFPGAALASSHMDAPLITFDDDANTTDVYAFVTRRNGADYLTVALAVYPFEEPGIGPNKYNFDDEVLYQIHVATGDDLAIGRETFSYRFRFTTEYRNSNTILQSYLGVVENVGDQNQNLIQKYRVFKATRSNGSVLELGRGEVPPNNQGIATRYYNQGDRGDAKAKDGVDSEQALDRYTAQSIANLAMGYRAFAGQRDDGFYGDIQAIFDLLQLRDPGVDAQAGFNVHMMALEIPLAELGGPDQTVGVFATTSRRSVAVAPGMTSEGQGNFVQIGRQGNPLFCEALVPIVDKDLYNRTRPTIDNSRFRQYAEKPELAALLNALVLSPDIPGIESGRLDIVAIFIPDLIKVDLSTGPARLAGGGPLHPTNPDDVGFSRLSVFGGDTLFSPLQGMPIAGGWPNGRRFGDDVVDIAITALISDLTAGIVRGPAGDNVDANDIAYNKVFPYAATPLSGRRHGHPGH